MTATSPTAPPRVHGPDVLRGLAACGVVFLHVLYLSGLEIGALSGAVFGRLDFLVRLFFAISTFSLAYAYHQRLDGQGALRDFYLRRFLRIAPLFYFVLISGVGYAWLVHGHAPDPYAVLLSLGFVFTVAPGMHGSLVGGGWSIGVEWVFYLAFPAILALTTSVRHCLLAGGFFLAIAIVGRDHYRGHFGGELIEYSVLFPLAHMHYFFVGFAVFLWRERLARWFAQAGWNGAGVVAAAAATIVYYLDPSVAHEEIVLSLTIFAMLAFAVAGLPGWLDSRPLRWLGKVSYSIYLMQFLVIRVYADAGVYRAIGESVGSADAAYAVAAALTVSSVIAVSALTWRWIEAPMQALGRPRHHAHLARAVGT